MTDGRANIRSAAIQPSTSRRHGRRAARRLRDAAEGRDPASCEKKRTADSVDAAVEQFIERHVKRNYRPKPMKEAERLLRLHAVKPWGSRKISEIRRTDVRRVLEGIVADGAPIAANRVHSISPQVFQLVSGAGDYRGIAVRRVEAAGRQGGLSRPSAERRRAAPGMAGGRKARGALSAPWCNCSILTGQRRGEVAGMQWGEIDLEKRLWTLTS